MRRTRLWTLLSILLLANACGDDDSSAPEKKIASNDSDPLYLIGSNLQTSDVSTLLLWTSPKLDDAELDTSDALQIVGGSEAFTLDDAVFVSNSEKQNITRYTVKNDKLVAGDSVSFANRGIMYVSYTYTVLNAERAFLVNSNQLEMIEWNPTTMEITKTHDMKDAFEREGWAAEYRGGFVRKSDGKFFFYWTYTNERVEFLNEFVLGSFDSKTDSFSVETKSDCPASAGFGGFFDEKEDLYLIADSFGLFTQYEYKDAKPACILRVKKGDSELDQGFTLKPSEAIGGREPWGFYYLADGLAYTSGVDRESFKKHKSVFEVLFAPEHSGWLIDLEKGEAKELSDLPADGVGFESHHVDNRLLVPRTAGTVEIEDIMSTQTTLFDIQKDGSATKLFSLPGYIAPVLRIR